MASVGNDVVEHAYHRVSYTTIVPFLFLAVTMWMAVELDHLVRGGEP